MAALRSFGATGVRSELFVAATAAGRRALQAPEVAVQRHKEFWGVVTRTINGTRSVATTESVRARPAAVVVCRAGESSLDKQIEYCERRFHGVRDDGEQGDKGAYWGCVRTS